MKTPLLTALLLVASLAGAWLSPSAQAGAPDNDRPIRIGADQRGGSLFKGGIRAVVIRGEALSPEDIARHAKRKPEAAPEAGDAKPVYQWVASDAGASGAAKGVFSGAKDAFIEDRGAAGLSLPDDFTIEAWIRPDADGAARIVDKILPGTADGFLLDLVNGKLRCIVGGATVAVPLGKPADPGGWTHVAAVFDGGKLALYVAGKKCGEGGDSRDEPTVKASTAEPPASPLTLWWDHPGRGWTDAMVMGNGRLGAMQKGAVRHETFWLNEDTLWSGEPFVPKPPKDAPATLAEMRKLLVDRRDGQAYDLYNRKFLGTNGECYEPLGNLNLDVGGSGKVTDYRRTLDLSTGIATVRYRQGGVFFTRESFVSYPDRAVIIRLSADKPGRVNFSAGLSSPLRHAVADAGAGVLRMTGRAPIHATPHYLPAAVVYDDKRGMTFAAELRAVPTGGTTQIADGKLAAKNCDSVTLVLSAATSYNGFDKNPATQGKDPVAQTAAQGAAAAGKPFADLRRRHAEDFSALMGRVSLDLGAGDAAKRPTDRRVHAGGYDAKDFPALAALYYQFGRYLLVASSRPGSQPANLQGIWNRSTNPPWASNWTTNCNANLNYLGVEAANLSELHEPFIRLVREWSADGARTAQAWYGCKGWVGHHNCDLWRNACPSGGNAVWAAFTSGGAWACRDLWEHYAFTLDKTYLKEVWPTMRGAAEFFLDFQFTDPKTGFLVSGPDTNFENSNTRGGGLCMGPTPSNQIIRQLYLDCIEASKVLDTDTDLRRRMEAALPKIPPTVVDPGTGEIQEYLEPDCRVASRSTGELLSHWGLIWSDQVTPRKTPELAAAMRKAYEAPDRRPWIHNSPLGSWVAAFPANTFARLHDGDRVEALLAKHFREAVNDNFTGAFIQSEWQIDGNLGMMAAIGELFLQSHAGEIELLPALPKSCAAQGSFKGLRARGGFTVDCAWKDGKVVSAVLHSTAGTSCKVRMGDRVVEVAMKPGESRTIVPAASSDAANGK